MTVLYPNLCYNDVCYKGMAMYLHFLQVYLLAHCIFEKWVLWQTADPDKMKQKAAFHQGLHCLLILKQTLGVQGLK